MKGFIYVGNHKDIKGIEDYLHSLLSVFQAESIEIEIGVDVNAVDIEFIILIDDFTNRPLSDYTRMLERWKRDGIVSILMHTEFLDKDGHFNIFSTKNKIYRKLLPSKLILYLRRRRDRHIIAKQLYRYSVYSYLLLGKILFMRLEEINARIYFGVRDQALKQVIRLFDIHTTISEDVHSCIMVNMPELKPINLFPSIDNNLSDLFRDCNLEQALCFISGNITPYRKSKISQYNRSENNFNLISQEYENLHKIADNLLSSKTSDQKGIIKKDDVILYPLLMTGFDLLISTDEYIKYVIKVYKKFDFLVEEMEVKSPLVFELYIGQTKEWPFLSPMRIVRALRADLLKIPVNIGKYRESSFDMLCINVNSIEELKDNRKKLVKDYIDKLQSNINLFNLNAHKANRILLDNILSKKVN